MEESKRQFLDAILIRPSEYAPFNRAIPCKVNMETKELFDFSHTDFLLTGEVTDGREWAVLEDSDGNSRLKGARLPVRLEGESSDAEYWRKPMERFPVNARYN